MARRKNQDLRRLAIHLMVDDLRNHPCMDCKNKFPAVCMDFDHRPGEHKIDTISQLVRNGASMAKILAEVAKCDLVCSNCHRIRTARRLNRRSAPP